MIDDPIKIRAKADELWEMGFKELADSLHQLAREVEAAKKEEFEANHKRLTAKKLLDALMYGFSEKQVNPWTLESKEAQPLLKNDDIVILKDRNIIFFRKDEEGNLLYIYHVATFTEDPIPLEDREIPYINPYAARIDLNIPVDVNEWVKKKLENGEENPYELGPPKVKTW
jgi:hypothetical protein